MNLSFIEIIGQLIVGLGLTLGLMFLSFKLVGKKINTINSNKYIRVIDRVQITKENSIYIIKVGKKGYVMTSTTGHMEKFLELSEEEIDIIEEDKKKAAKEIAEGYNNLMLKSKEGFSKIVKNIRSKEEKHEKK